MVLPVPWSCGPDLPPAWEKLTGTNMLPSPLPSCPSTPALGSKENVLKINLEGRFVGEISNRLYSKTWGWRVGWREGGEGRASKPHLLKTRRLWSLRKQPERRRRGHYSHRLPLGSCRKSWEEDAPLSQGP
jgi:hypothetical protein